MINDESPTSNSAKAHTENEATLFDPVRYEEHKLTIAVSMGRYMIRHLLLLYREFEGDLLLPIVLGEIAHHNVGGLYHQNGPCLKPRSQIPTGPERLNYMEPTNAFSISESTGIPRETVRRKIDKLVEKGWVTKGTRSELTITTSVSDYFTSEFNKKLLTELLATSSCITDLLNED